jgi:arabinan endo-1,5-alpha-L-arabinosidase
MKTKNIHIRDPFVFPNRADNTYYLFGTTSMGTSRTPGFDCFTSQDLVEWQGPIPAFRPSSDFWGTSNFWAPEVHYYHNRYYMFGSFKADLHYRGTQILVADRVSGPYTPLIEKPITPPNWECLDGTLYVDQDENPWIVFCHEWVQVHNGAIFAMQLSQDLKESVSPPVFLFNASDALWVRNPGWPPDGSRHLFPTYVTDGPFLYRIASGALIMLWSSIGTRGYAMGIARSDTGTITGFWRQVSEPLWAEDGGHGMIFRAFDGRLMVTFHRPNKNPEERPVFVEIEETDNGIRLKT